MSNDVVTQQNGKAIRLTFSYGNNDLQLISQQKIEKLLPLSGSIDNIPQNGSGFWYELSDSGGNILYRQIMHSPIKIDNEVFSNDPNESNIRQELTDILGTFAILVPVISQAINFDMFSSPILSEGAKGIDKPATKIFHVDLQV